MSITSQTMRTVTLMRCRLVPGLTYLVKINLPLLFRLLSHYVPTFNAPVSSPPQDTTSPIIRMVLWLEPKACTNCGLMQAGHTRKNCPDIKCFRCHKHGHISDDCPNTKCSYCRVTGHCKSKCPTLKLRNREGHNTSTLSSSGNTRAGPGGIGTPASTKFCSHMPSSQRVQVSRNTVGPKPTLSPPATQETTMVSSKVAEIKLIY